MLTENNHRFLACTLLEAYYQRQIDRHIDECFAFYSATGMALESHPVAIDEAEDAWFRAYMALLPTLKDGSFERGTFGLAPRLVALS